MRIKFIATVFVKQPKPATGRKEIELEYEKNLKEEKSLDDIMDGARDVLVKNWGYKENQINIKKISIID